MKVLKIKLVAIYSVPAVTYQKIQEVEDNIIATKEAVVTLTEGRNTFFVGYPWPRKDENSIKSRERRALTSKKRSVVVGECSEILS